MDRLLLVVLLLEDRVHTPFDHVAHLVLDGDARHLGLEAALLAARADDLVVEEGDVAELAGESALAVVELAVHDDADCHAAAHVEVDHVALVLRFAARVLGVAACTGVVLEQHADADALLEDIAQRLFVGCEVLVAAARIGVHAAGDADAQPEDLAPVDAALGDEPFDVRADAFDALRAVLQFEREVVLLLDDVVLKVGDHETHVVAADVHAGKVDRRIGQPEDVRPASSRGFDLAQIRDDVLIDKFLDELGDRRNTDVQLLGQLRERALAVYGHVRDDVALDDVVFVRYALEGFVLVFVEKFG